MSVKIEARNLDKSYVGKYLQVYYCSDFKVRPIVARIVSVNPLEGQIGWIKINENEDAVVRCSFYKTDSPYHVELFEEDEAILLAFKD